MVKAIKLFVLVIITGALFTACGEKKNLDKASSVKNKIVIAQGADAKSLDPHASNDAPSSKVSAQIYDRLFEQDLKMIPQPSLAESWTQINPKTIEIKLKKNVKFHNGEILKASDVKFTLDRMKKSPAVSHIIGAVEKIDVIDDNTVRISTKTPFGPLLSHLSHTASSILNEKAVTDSGDNYGQFPIGTGPYKFESWTPGDRIILKANKDYFKGVTPIETVVFRSIVEGTNRTIGLETGEIDIAYDIEPMDVGRIQEDKNLNLISEPSLQMAYIGFNMKKDIYKDKRVRQAIAYAINVDPIIQTVYQGQGEAANSPIGPLVVGYSEKAKGYEHNLEKAKKLMIEAGYPNGFTTKIWTNDSPQRRDMAIIVQDQLKAIGINVIIETLEWGAYLEGTSRGDHDMYLLSWVSVTGDADYGLYPLFSSTTHGGAGNRSFYSSAKVDELLEKARASSNLEERIALYDEAQIIIQEELPIMTVAYLKHNAGVNKSVKNFVLHPAGHHKLYGVSF